MGNRGLLRKLMYAMAMNKYLIYGYRFVIATFEYAFVLAPLYIHIVMIITYIQSSGLRYDYALAMQLLFGTPHVILPGLMYLYLLSKCRNGLSVSFMLRFRGLPAPFSLSIFLVYSVSLSLLVFFVDATSVLKNYVLQKGYDEGFAEFEVNYSSRALSLMGVRINNTGILYSSLLQLVKSSYYEIYLALLGTVLAVMLILLYSSSEYLSGEPDVYVHKHTLRNLIELFRKSKKKIVISGYGFLGKAVVRGLFEHIASTRPQHGIEIGYTYVWDQKENNLRLKSDAANILIISKDSEEWDYRIDHPVYKNIGAEEVEYSLGQSSLVLVLGPNIRSDFLLKQSGSYDAKIFAHTFRDKSIESFLYTKTHQLFIPEFSGTTAIRSTKSASLVSLTLKDLEVKIHRYYPEYVFANLLLRRLYMILLKVVKNGKKPLVVAMGRGKTLYYIIESIRILENNVGDFLELNIYKKIDSLNIPNIGGVLDVIIVSDDREILQRTIPYVQFKQRYNINNNTNNIGSLSFKVIEESTLLKESAEIYITMLRYIGRNEPNNMIVPLIRSRPDSFSIISEIIAHSINEERNSSIESIVPIFIVSSNIEGENMHVLNEILRAQRFIRELKQMNKEDPEFYAIVSLMRGEEYTRLQELAYLYGCRDRVYVVNVYKTVKESLCSFISSLIIGED